MTASPSGLATRLCKALEAYVKQVKSPTPSARRGLDAQLEVCYGHVQASKCASTCPSDNPRHVTSWQRRMLAGQAGLKIKAFETNSEQELRAAVAATVCWRVWSGAMCQGVCVDVRNVYFYCVRNKCSTLQPTSSRRWWPEARLLDGGAANWKDAHAIHTQLPGIRATPLRKPWAPWLGGEAHKIPHSRRAWMAIWSSPGPGRLHLSPARPGSELARSSGTRSS